MDTKSFEYLDNCTYLRFSNPSLIEKDFQTLIGILEGIRSDLVINIIEHNELRDWVNSHKEYENKPPYSEAITMIRAAVADGVLSDSEIEDIIWYCKRFIDKNDYFDSITGGIQQLLGIVKGIIIDQEINIAELAFLDQWLEENEYLKNAWPYDELYSLTTKIIQDKAITAEEHHALLNFFQALTGENSHSTSNTALIDTLKTGFYQIDPVITIPERTFCITGISKKYKRKEIAQKIELYGGFMVDNVSAKLDYLIVCNEKNNCWAFTCYGRKIEEAIKHRKSGIPLVIVHEFDLYDELESYA